MRAKLRVWRAKFLAMRSRTNDKIIAAYIAAQLRLLRINAWLNVASIGVLAVIGAVLGLAVIVAMISAGVRG